MLRTRFLAEAQQPLPQGLRVDLVDRVSPATWGELKARLSQTPHSAFDLGVAFDPGLQQALLAQEIHGNAIFHDDSVERAELNPDHLHTYGQARFATRLDFPANDAAPVWCFKTRAVYVDAAGARPIDRHRVTGELEVDEVRGFIEASGRHLAAQVEATGKFRYGWAPCFDQAIPAYDTWHHASATLALLEAWALSRSDELKAAIDRALVFLTRQLIRPAKLPDGSRAAFLLDLDDEIRLGGNGACLRALVKYAELSGDLQYEPLMEHLALGLLHMRLPGSGQFVHVLQASTLQVKATFRAIDHDSEAALGLLCLHRLSGDARWLAAVETAFEHFIASQHWRARDHRLSHCVNELTRHRPERRYFQFGLRNVAGAADFASAHPAALLEQVVAALETVFRLEADPLLRPLLSGEEHVRLCRALTHHAQALADSRFGPELAMFFANPARLDGAFFAPHHGFRVRIDDTAHALLGCVAWHQFLRRAAGLAAEDPMPALLQPGDGPVVAWGGNVNLGRRQNYRALELGAAAMLGDVPVMAEADLRIVNLECVVSDRGERIEATAGELLHHCRARPEMLGILAEAGIDLVATANDHSGDYGDEARAHQMALLDAAGIGHTGSGPTLDAALQPVLRRAGELNVALFAIDTTCERLAAGDGVAGSAYLPLSMPSALMSGLASRIAAARERAYVVLVAVHWGTEGSMSPCAEEIAMGRALIDAGADAVLGSSSHVLHGVEIYRNRPIVHDAGDLLFDARHREDDRGGVFSLQLSRDGVQRVVFTPVRVGYGQTVQLDGRQAMLASHSFRRQCKVLGADFLPTRSGQCFIDLQPPAREAATLPPLSPVARCPDAIHATTQPLGAWLTEAVPRAAKLEWPLTLGPLRLLGASITPGEIIGRRMLRVETYWTLDAPTAIDWRLDLCVVPAARVFMPPWGVAMDHDPCDWMWPTSRWQPGHIYRDVHDLRPPAATASLYDTELQLVAGLVHAGTRIAPVRVPRFIDFTVRPDQPTPPPPAPLPAAPIYRTVSLHDLPPDLPGVPDPTWNAAQLVAVTGGRWLVEPPPGWFVRSVPRGELFLDLMPGPLLFASSDHWTLALHEGFGDLQNERNWDWGDHVARMQPSIAGVMLAKPIEGLAPDFPVLLVDDPMRALIELGVAARERLRGQVIAITGSAGKTSTCQMLKHVFSPSLRLVSTLENYNSRLGMLAMLANVPAQTDLVVLETAVSAINAPGLQNIKLVRPDLAIVTNIAASHLDKGETIADVARRKANIFEGMRSGAWAVLCTDTEYFDYLVTRARARELRVLTYGTAASADFRLEAYDAASGRIRASHHGRTFEYPLGAKGLHMAVNSLVCFAVAHALALDGEALPQQLASFAAVEGRGKSLTFRLGDRRFQVIDESYNANPISMTAALAMVAQEPGAQGRKLLVLGDMLELGDDAQRYHEALVEPIARCEPALVFLLGASMSALRAPVAAALPAGSDVRSFESLDALEAALLHAIASGDILLLKSSNGMRLWQIVRTLTRRQEAEDKERKREEQEEERRQQTLAPMPPMPLPPAAVIRRTGTPAATMPTAPSWVLYDMSADRLLTHQPASHPFVPASLSKLLTAFLVEQKLQAEGLDRHSEQVPVAAEPQPAPDDPAASLYAGAVAQPVQRLLEAALIVSSDKAALELASWHSGDFDAFVAAMNRQAQIWGLHDTHFSCPAGLRRMAHTTAVDMLAMARHVLREFPSVLEVSAMTQLDGVALAAPSTNLLLGRVSGVDGLKTGTLPDCGSHLIATAQRGGRRLISVVLGAQDHRTCAQLSALLLQQGFETPHEHGA